MRCALSEAKPPSRSLFTEHTFSIFNVCIGQASCRDIRVTEPLCYMRTFNCRDSLLSFFLKRNLFGKLFTSSCFQLAAMQRGQGETFSICEVNKEDLPCVKSVKVFHL